MISVIILMIFLHRQEANVTLILFANYTWYHTVSFIGVGDLIKKVTKKQLKLDSMKMCLECTCGDPEM